MINPVIHQDCLNKWLTLLSTRTALINVNPIINQDSLNKWLTLLSTRTSFLAGWAGHYPFWAGLAEHYSFLGWMGWPLSFVGWMGWPLSFLGRMGSPLSFLGWLGRPLSFLCLAGWDIILFGLAAVWGILRIILIWIRIWIQDVKNMICMNLDMDPDRTLIRIQIQAKKDSVPGKSRKFEKNPNIPCFLCLYYLTISFL